MGECAYAAPHFVLARETIENVRATEQMTMHKYTTAEATKQIARISATFVFVCTFVNIAHPEPPEEGEQRFVSLFDATTLNGWQGATEHWAADEGSLVFTWKGAARSKEELLGLKLMSTRQYSDFILRFDCKLPKVSNNGVAIRAPLEGDPAFVGMEIQIQDTRYYRKLRDYDVFGSVYGVVPAKTGHLEPNGQWNTEEIRCVGKHIRVTLNGIVIVDVDLDSLGGKTADGKRHPGLGRKKGHLGFLGHTARVEFRNIRIRTFPVTTRKASAHA